MLASSCVDASVTHGLVARAPSARAHPTARSAPARKFAPQARRSGLFDEDSFRQGLKDALGSRVAEDLSRLADDFVRSARAASARYEAANTVDTEATEKGSSQGTPLEGSERTFKTGAEWASWMQAQAKARHEAELKSTRAFPVDIVEDAQRFNLYADVPGLTSGDLKVKVDAKSRRLTISGERKRPAEMEGLDADGKPSYDGKRVLERATGSFSRSFMMSKKCDLESVTARVEKGVLHLMVEKKAEEEPTTVEVPIWD